MVMSPDGPSPPGTPQVKSLNCPSCGAALVIRSFGQAVTVVCSHCHLILDAKDPNLKILQKFTASVYEDSPLIPLGTRGTIRGAAYDVIGFDRRTIHVEGVSYSWHEYVLFNPYKGFRYLTEYNGHWNDTTILRSLPTFYPNASPPALKYLGETYKQFQTAQAGTNFVLGEFPWQARVGESVEVCDYVSPPRLISSEKTGKEITWSMGEYMSGADVWKAFNLDGRPPEAVGVYENQPYPLSKAVTSIWIAFTAFLLIFFFLLMGFTMFAQNQLVYQGNYEFNSDGTGEASFIVGTFNLTGRTSDLQLETSTSLDNQWIYLNYALINQDTGQAYDVGREISYYYGYDSDGAWTEGSRRDTVAIPSVPSGTYYLRVEPESDPGLLTIFYSIALKRDVPQLWYFGIAFLALLIPPALITWRSINFEHLRWAESDYPPAYSGSDNSDEPEPGMPDQESQLFAGSNQAHKNTKSFDEDDTP
jgi:hypothetical protein